MYIYTLEHPSLMDAIIILDHPLPDLVRKAYQKLGYTIGSQRVH